MVTCEACKLEAEIGTEKVPHPIDLRLHTCKPKHVLDEKGLIRCVYMIEPDKDWFSHLNFFVNAEHHKSGSVLIEADSKSIEWARDEIMRLQDRIAELEDDYEPKPGQEAEELRKGIEKLIAAAESVENEMEEEVDVVLADDLQGLLDGVDARDSLDYLEGKHPVLGASQRAAVVRTLAGLRYDSLAEVFTDLSKRLEEDMRKDRDRGREKLAARLEDLVNGVGRLRGITYAVWEVCKFKFKKESAGCG